jgi:SWI/SNF-related matrix-associated actin-dependent regulator 1 of chromatin subfamily A
VLSFPYQTDGARWLTEARCRLLADEMGLGKTVQAILAADDLLAQRILVICPAVARQNWAREFQRFSIFKRPCLVGLSGTDVPPPTAGVVVTSYELAVRFHEQNLLGSFDVLIIDEGQFLKSVDAKRSAAILGTNGVRAQCKRVWVLSGTPMPNHPGELWILLFTFGATQLRYDQFCIRFCQYAKGAGPFTPRPQIVGAKQERREELHQLLSRIMLRRTKEEVLQQLPDIIFSDVIVQRTPVKLELTGTFHRYTTSKENIEELREKLRVELADLKHNLGRRSIESADGFRQLELMAKSVSTLRMYVGLQKVGAVAEMILHELDNELYEKVVIFAIHRDVIEGLRQALLKYGPVTLYGGTDPNTRQRNVDRFQSNPKCRIFIGNIAAAGTAITLTAADQVVFIEQEWTPAQNAQAAKRCHRIGQTRTVNVRFVGLNDSIDEKIANVLLRKTRDIVAIVDGGVISRGSGRFDEVGSDESNPLE